MDFRVPVAVCVILAGSLTSAVARDPNLLPEPLAKALLAKVERQSMIFFVVKGGPNSCGPGCDEWIVADGAFDFASSKRFKEFLESLPRRDLPVFFNSIGGSVSQAAEIATLLRAHRMKAGVARTLPEGCRSVAAADDACRRLVGSKKDMKAKLVTRGATCASACVVALVGASSRQIAADARAGVHSFADARMSDAKPKTEDVDNARKRFFVYMGVDAGLMDLTNKTRFERIHFMSRGEIAKFGIETRGFYETQWMPDKTSPSQSPERFFAHKSVTLAEGDEYRTTRISVMCPDTRGTLVSYQRELLKNEGVGSVTLGLGSKALTLEPDLPLKDIETKRINVGLELLRRAAAEPSIEVAEKLWLQGEYKSRVTKISTTGLLEALDRCGPRPLKPAQATAG
jgi:hypothetical protein